MRANQKVSMKDESCCYLGSVHSIGAGGVDNLKGITSDIKTKATPHGMSVKRFKQYVKRTDRAVGIR